MFFLIFDQKKVNSFKQIDQKRKWTDSKIKTPAGGDSFGSKKKSKKIKSVWRNLKTDKKLKDRDFYLRRKIKNKNLFPKNVLSYHHRKAKTSEPLHPV